MRWQELKNKEIINVHTGERLGIFGDCDFEFNVKDGKINTVLIPVHKGYFPFLSDKKVIPISWDNIKKIGPDMIIIDK